MADQQDPWAEFLSNIQCIVHMRDYDEDCEACTAEMDALQHALTKVEKINQSVEARIAYLGHTIDKTDLIIMRLSTLIEMLMASNPKMRAIFEVVFARNCEQALHQTETNVNRQRLTMGGGMPPGLVKP